MRRLALLLCAIALSGCSVGAVAVRSSGLGFEPTYGGLYGALEADHVEGEAQLYPGAKRGSEGNLSGSGRILAGSGWWRLGLYGSYSSTPDWEKWTVAPMGLVRLEGETARLDLFATGPDGDKIDGSVGVRLSGRWRVSPLVEYEKVIHTEGSGDRLMVGLVWRISRWQP